MEARCAKWSGAFRAMSLERRIITMNVFVLSMLVYIGMFFPLPYGEKTVLGLAPLRGPFPKVHCVLWHWLHLGALGGLPIAVWPSPVPH